MAKIRSWFNGVVLGALVGSAPAFQFFARIGRELKSRAADYVENVKEEIKQAGIEKRRELEEELALMRSGKI